MIGLETVTYDETKIKGIKQLTIKYTEYGQGNELGQLRSDKRNQRV